MRPFLLYGHEGLFGEEFLHAIHPAFCPRIVATAVALVDFLEFVEQLLLPRSEIDRRLHHDVAEQVAKGLAAHALDAFAAQPEYFP